MRLDSRKVTPEMLARIPSLAGVFARHPQVELAYLFGSAASGRMTSLSDVDLAVLLAPGLSRDQRWKVELELVEEIAAHLGTESFDLVVLNQAPLTLRYQVVRGGRLLYARDEQERVEFEAGVRTRYFDFAPLQAEYYGLFFQRIKEGRMADGRSDQNPASPQ